MPEIWHIVWFCLTVGNADCDMLNKREHGVAGVPWDYYSEMSCKDYASFLAEKYEREKGFRIAYECRRGASEPERKPRRDRRRR
jgi:hypothetical protein